MSERICQWCGGEIAPTKRSHAIYCSKRCGRAASAARNPEQVLVRKQRYRESHREELNEKSRRYNAENPERKREACRRWELANPERTRALKVEMTARAKARSLGAFVAPVDPDLIYERDHGVCGICGEPVERSEMEMDHIIPLARGGTHEPSNCQPAHQFCNRSKKNKLPEEMAA